MRTATVERRTAETQVQVTLDLDGSGQYDVSTGVGFLDHMLRHVAVHGLLDLSVRAQGDLEIDSHHTVEDVALALGACLDRAAEGFAAIRPSPRARPLAQRRTARR